MILQFSNVSPSEYHARYSPLNVLFFTVIFSPCQNASLVSKVQFSKTAFLIYWKEYLPLKVTPRNVRFSERIIKYSLTAVLSSIRMPRTDQPNSGEIISQSRITTSLHSRRALIPCIFVSVISIWPEYQRDARQSSVISEPEILSPWSCQNGD